MSEDNEVNVAVRFEASRVVEAKQATSQVGGGGRGTVSRARGRLDVKLASPYRPVRGIQPEELFAAGWSASLLSAIEQTAVDLAVRLPSARAVDAQVELGNASTDGHFRKIRLAISLPGLQHEVARELVEIAHAACPYWKATRGNIDVAIEIG